MRKKMIFVMMFLGFCISFTGIILASEFDMETRKANSKKEEFEKKRTDLQAKIEELEANKGDVMLYIEGLDKQMQMLLIEEETTELLYLSF